MTQMPPRKSGFSLASHESHESGNESGTRHHLGGVPDRTESLPLLIPRLEHGSARELVLVQRCPLLARPTLGSLPTLQRGAQRRDVR